MNEKPGIVLDLLGGVGIYPACVHNTRCAVGMPSEGLLVVRQKLRKIQSLGKPSSRRPALP
jgi:hypothetical protein